MELERVGLTPIAHERFKDTVPMARARFPGSPASLDALCKRFEISLESRTKHGALIDAYLLSEVYLELNGGREQRLDFTESRQQSGKVIYPQRAQREKSLPSRLSKEERDAHACFVSDLGEIALWSQFEKG